MSELSPVFRLQVWLDGQDNAHEATENFRRLLSAALGQIQGMGAIRAWHFEDGTEETR